MRLGIRASGHRPAAEVIALAVAAENAGFDEIWLTEDYLERGIFSIAGAVASATNSITIGLGVVNPFTRHPGLTAMEAAALCELAPGRVILALGGSNKRWMNEWLGIEFSHPLAAVREARAIIATLLAGHRVDHNGRHFSVSTKMAFHPDPVPPIWYGVKGPLGVAAAAEDAQGVTLSTLSSAPYVEWVRGIVGPTKQIAAFVEFLIDEDDAAAYDAVRPAVAKYLGMHGDAEITRQAGLDRDVALRLSAAVQAGSPDVKAVTDEVIDMFAVVGGRQRCADGLRRFAAAGLDTFVVGDQVTRSPTQMVIEAADCWAVADIAESSPT